VLRVWPQNHLKMQRFQQYYQIKFLSFRRIHNYFDFHLCEPTDYSLEEEESLKDTEMEVATDEDLAWGDGMMVSCLQLVADSYKLAFG